MCATPVSTELADRNDLKLTMSIRLEFGTTVHLNRNDTLAKVTQPIFLGIFMILHHSVDNDT